jgi:hypothetical protein
MVERAQGHLVASGTATIGMGCAPLKPQRRGVKQPSYGGSFGGYLAHWLESLGSPGGDAASHPDSGRAADAGKSGSYSAACGNAAVTVTPLVHPDLRFNEAVFLLNAG